MTSLSCRLSLYCRLSIPASRPVSVPASRPVSVPASRPVSQQARVARGGEDRYVGSCHCLRTSPGASERAGRTARRRLIWPTSQSAQLRRPPAPGSRLQTYSDVTGPPESRRGTRQAAAARLLLQPADYVQLPRSDHNAEHSDRVSHRPRQAQLRRPVGILHIVKPLETLIFRYVLNA